MNEKEVETIRNKEVKMALYDSLGLFPENPSEFVRYLIYTSIKKTLLIKDPATIEMIKSKENNLQVLNLLLKYKREYGLERLAGVFYRFKPIFLAFRTNSRLKLTINRIRRFAKKNHTPMKEDYLNEITSKIKRKKKIDEKKLKAELNRVNTFRKVRLAYALKFRTKDVNSILYKIRNGKGYATSFESKNKTRVKKILAIVLDSIVNDVKKNVKGKKIYLPEEINYTLPATEKQFTGNLPSGTYVSIPDDMIVGIHWEDVGTSRIDLDLSLLSVDKKIGWDADYRTAGKDVLFSGDVTAAPKPEGASELFYAKRQVKHPYLLSLNYYNYEKEVEVPFKILVAKEEAKSFKNNYMVNPNNVITIASSKINQKQMVLGLLVPTTKGNRFYFSETVIGQNITSSNSDFANNTRKYLLDFYSNTIELKDILKKAGAKFVKSKEKAEIDLSPESLEKDTILGLLSTKK